jgi:hypothetical protein
MKTEREIQTAWQIWISINQLNDLLWDRYEDEFIEINLQEELDKTRPREEKSLGAIQPLNLTTPQDKTKA